LVWTLIFKSVNRIEMRIFERIVLSVSVVAIMASCKKEVDLQPTDFAPLERTFRTVNDLNSGTLGVYGTWLQRRPIYTSAIISDEARQGSGTEYRGVGANLFRWEHTSDAQDFRDAENAGIWTNMYAVIDRANRVLAFLDAVPASTQADMDTKQRLRGELLALRGFAHFELLRNYARFPYDPSAPGVPYQSEYAKDPANYRPTRNTSGDVMNKIEADLSAARGLIPTSFTDISRVTRNGVVAMQARVAVYARNWDSAAARATVVINAQPLTPRASYAALWTTRNLAANQSTEVIWKLNVTATNVTSAAVGNMFQDASGAVQFAPSQKLLGSYDQTNDIRFPTFYRTAPRDLIAKYGAITSLPTTENFTYDIKVLRTSEMYLIRAEARAELNDLIGAAADIFALRSQRITGALLPVYTSKQVAIDDVYLERYRELSFEGHRYYDLKRRGLPIQRNLEDVNNVASLTQLDPSNPRYLLPIPQQEIFANPNVTQNPGY